MGQEESFFKTFGEAVERFESVLLLRKIREMEESKFKGDDGKEYFRIPLPPRYTAKDQK